MLVKIILVILAIWVFIKLVKFLGKFILIIVILLFVAVAAMSQNTNPWVGYEGRNAESFQVETYNTDTVIDTTSLSESFNETKKSVVKTTKIIAKSDEYKKAKTTATKVAKSTVKTIGKSASTVSEWFMEGWNEK